MSTDLKIEDDMSTETRKESITEEEDVDPGPTVDAMDYSMPVLSPTVTVNISGQSSEPVITEEKLRTFPWRRKRTPWSEIAAHQYAGAGTVESPYVVTWLPEDVENPLGWSYKYKWLITILAACGTLVVSMSSSMLSAAIWDVELVFPNHSSPTYTMVTSVFVLGFVFGPLLWAPCSEVYGRRAMFVYTYIPFTIFASACCGAKSIVILLVMRFFSGFFGCSAMTNAGGTIADLFEAHERGLAMGVFAAAPFLGPAIGPVVGGFLSEQAGWSWVAAVIAIIAFTEAVLGFLLVPETYAPVLLRHRATELSKMTGMVYKSQQDIARPLNKKQLFTRQLQKPWILMLKEPIVLLLSLYLSVIYTILYMQFTSFPLIFQGARGWSPGISGLAFVGITIGAFMSLAYIVFFENPRYARKIKDAGGYLPPEERLRSVIVGAVLMPLSLFIFAWTGVPVRIPWIAPILATVPYGAATVFLFLGISNYLVDAYLMYAASVLAGGTVLRSSFGVVFPLFTTTIYDNLGINLAGTLIACLTLIFAPAPLIFFRYGRKIRRLSKYAREADDLGQMLVKRTQEAAARAEAEKQTQTETV